MTRPRVLIEEWLPIEAIGVESKRERGASSALPPLYFLHVWWARRPLVASRAAILGSVLPAWSSDWPKHLLDCFPTQESYHKWFVYLCGIRGDPVAGYTLVNAAKARGIKLDFNPYAGAPRAFTVSPSPDDLRRMGDLLEYAWGTRDLSVLDPFAGGGSIPFEALRYGFTTYANDLNPVAAVILKATLDYPARFGPVLADDIRKWGKIWAQRVEEKLAPYFPKQPGESIFAYLWARTVACPTTGKPVPLSPNWWLSRDPEPVAVQVIAEPHMQEPEFRIVRGDAVKKINPDAGTVNGGNARSPWTGEVVDGAYIKAEAQAGRMGEILYAVVFKATGTEKGLCYRSATSEDRNAVARATEVFHNGLSEWQVQDVLPDEAIGISNYDRGHRLYGRHEWISLFSPRQAVALGAFIEALAELRNTVLESHESEFANAVLLYLGLALDKAVDRNSCYTSWVSQRQVIAHTFDRHNYAIKWSFAEFDAAASLLPWALGQIEDAYSGISRLCRDSHTLFQAKPSSKLVLLNGSAVSLKQLRSGTISNISVDPPYYDNVQYSEVADFFYVWLKRSVGPLFPDLFTNELTNKDDEAVANPARFAAFGSKKKALADQDYERKMAAAFREMHRVLRDDGVLTVMFTHKRVEAWDTLASALIGAGFTIHASWPVHTEFEYSLHQAKKNAAGVKCRP